MGKVAGKVVRVYADEFALSGYLNAATLNLKQETPVVTTFSDAGPRRVTAEYDYDSSDQGFFDGVDNAFDERMFVDLWTDEDHYLAHILSGSAVEGDIGYEDIVRFTSQPRVAAQGAAILLSFDAAGSNGKMRCTVLKSATLTGANTGAGQNLGITTAPARFAAVFRVLSFSGVDITLKIQESSDDGAGDTYADISGLTSGALTAVGVVRASTIATTEAWKRVVATTTGGITSMLVLVTVGTVAGT